jgi:hypothetical protein
MVVYQAAGDPGPNTPAYQTNYIKWIIFSCQFITLPSFSNILHHVMESTTYFVCPVPSSLYINNFVALVRKRTTLTEWSLLVGEVSANLFG